MTPLAYLLIILILVVLLDLGLLNWTQRYLEKHGISADHESAVYLLSKYSPILTWLKCACLSIQGYLKNTIKQLTTTINNWGIGKKDRTEKSEFQEGDALSKSPVAVKELARVHLRFHISSNERIQITVDSLSYTPRNADLVNIDSVYPNKSIENQVVSAAADKLSSESSAPHEYVKEKRKRKNNKHQYFSFVAKNRLVVDVVIVLFALIPAILVVMDRWFRTPLTSSSLSEYWNRIASPLDLAFPAYIFVILISMLIIFTLLLMVRDNALDIYDQDMSKENIHEPITPDTHQIKWGTWILIASWVLLIVAVFVYIRLHVVVGWWFLLSLLFYVVGWLLREVSSQTVLDNIRNNGVIIISYAVFYLSCVYLLAAINLKWYSSWLFLIIVLFTFANVLRHHQRIHPILWSVPIFLTVYAYRINGWEFSVIGDEYIFFEYAKNLVTSRDLVYIGNHLFDGQAVFGSHPFFSSLLQAIPMKMFGENNFAWRISNSILVSVSIPLFYYFFRAYTSQFIATVTALLLGFSHYLITFNKIGYNNLQALFILALVLSVAAWTIKTEFRIRYVILGVCFGFCFYVYPAALYVFVIGLIFMLFYNPPITKEVARNWLVMGGICMIMVLPILLQPGFWQTKVAGTLLYNPALLENIVILSKHIFSNLLYSLISFLYIVDESHFVTASYVDPLTALFCLLGLLYSLTWVRKDRFIAYICISYAVLLFLVGASHDRRFPPTTRMFLLLPWFAFFASVGIRWLYNLFTRITARIIDVRSYLLILLVAVIMLNLFQAYSLSVQRSSRYQSPEMLFLRLVQNMQARKYTNTDIVKFLFLTDGRWDINGYRIMQDVYSIPASFMELDRYVVGGENWLSDIVRTIEDQNTMVIVYANFNQDMLTGVEAHLSSLHKEVCPVMAFDGSTRFYLWYSDQMQWVCDES